MGGCRRNAEYCAVSDLPENEDLSYAIDILLFVIEEKSIGSSMRRNASRECMSRNKGEQTQRTIRLLTVCMLQH